MDIMASHFFQNLWRVFNNYTFTFNKRAHSSDWEHLRLVPGPWTQHGQQQSITEVYIVL